MRLFCLTIAVLTIVNTGISIRVACAQFGELARQVPSSANSIAFVNVEKLMESPIAKREGWADKRDQSFGAGLTMLPPDGKYAILASQVDLSVWTPLWETAILQLDHKPSMAKVAGMTSGTLDNIAGHEAVALPADAYAVKISDTIAAFMAPANRQTASRWMREVDGRREHGLSPYLTEAFHFANELGTPVVLALDLEDALAEDSIKELLAQPSAKEFLAKNKLDSNRVLAMLSSIRGVTLGITFNEKPFGKIKVDFRSEVILTPEAAKSALLHALSERGAMIDEFAGWKPSVTDKQLLLEGFLERSGMRRISSLFDRPPSLKTTEPTAQAAQTGSQNTNSKPQQMAQMSQSYFTQVGELLEDLSKERKNNSGYTMAQIGVWMDKYAKKIDQLSVLNVDPEMIDYGAYVADGLRAGYGAIRTGAARSRIRQVNTQMPTNTYGYEGIYGYSYRTGVSTMSDRRAYQHERTAVKAEERVSSAQSARDIMGQIDKATAEVRRKMTQKYQINF